MPQPRDVKPSNTSEGRTEQDGEYRDKMLDCPNNNPYERNPLNDVGGYQDYDGRHGDYDCHFDAFGEGYSSERVEEAVDFLSNI